MLHGIEARQLSAEEKAGRADLVVQNDGDLVRLKGQAEELGRRVRERGTNGNVRQET